MELRIWGGLPRLRWGWGITELGLARGTLYALNFVMISEKLVSTKKGGGNYPMNSTGLAWFPLQKESIHWSRQRVLHRTETATKQYHRAALCYIQYIGHPCFTSSLSVQSLLSSRGTISQYENELKRLKNNAKPSQTHVRGTDDNKDGQSHWMNLSPLRIHLLLSFVGLWEEGREGAPSDSPTSYSITSRLISSPQNRQTFLE